MTKFEAEHITGKDLFTIYLKSRGNLTLTKLCDLILGGDTACVDDLLSTIQATIGATETRLHFQAVKRLHGKCIVLGGMLFGKDFDRKAEIEEAFTGLSGYSESSKGINSRLH